MNLARNAVDRLLAQRSSSGVWEGRLSSSALSTATAVIALAANDPDSYVAARGRAWLMKTQNDDGGWGDTTLSLSNISTTALCWAALPHSPSTADSVARAEAWLRAAAGSLDPKLLSAAIARRYGRDRTFSVPILTALAIAGRLGEEREAWRLTPQLPFELAACPHRWFQWLRLPVVSYALPALIAIGLVRHRRRPSLNPAARVLRNALTPRCLRVLERIQPQGGGFLEATPLTSFVAMSLIAAGLSDHAVTQRCLVFLCRSVRDDGSWPIDTNLATWVTTMAINHLAEGGDLRDALSAAERDQVCEWLLTQQFREEHPYTHAAPGAWAWTNLSGGVPDADDTAGALLALKNLDNSSDRALAAASQGIRWLLDLQNRDGGMPTFCRGWGHLPFDRSGPDLTAHALRGWLAWLPELPRPDRDRVSRAIERALRYLEQSQHPDGSWAPLWFGNQHAPGDENRTFGTARVVLALCDASPESPMLASATGWLLAAQNASGGWGGVANVTPSIEETALAATALARVAGTKTNIDRQAVLGALRSALTWIENNTADGTAFPPSPIGFYFASLWYFEELYPLLFTVSAMRRIGGSKLNQWELL